MGFLNCAQKTYKYKSSVFILLVADKNKCAKDVLNSLYLVNMKKLDVITP
jgi:hypothetical protein